MPTPSRPLSPHLQVYRWQISNSLSILNRLTGVILSVAFLMFCGWLVLAAAGLKGYQPFADLLRGPLGAVALAGISLAFFFHLLNGIRHLFWDVGLGFEKLRARRTGWLVVAGTLLLSLGLMLWVLA